MNGDDCLSVSEYHVSSIRLESREIDEECFVPLHQICVGDGNDNGLRLIPGAESQCASRSGVVVGRGCGLVCRGIIHTDARIDGMVERYRD